MTIEAMKQALEALELMYACYAHPEWISHKQQEEKILAQCVATTMTLRQAIEQAEKQDGDRVIRSIKQEAETGLVVGDKVGMRDALQQILREADKHLGIEA